MPKKQTKPMLKCPHVDRAGIPCGYVWAVRTKAPVSCPRCRGRLDRGKPAIKVAGGVVS